MDIWQQEVDLKRTNTGESGPDGEQVNVRVSEIITQQAYSKVKGCNGDATKHSWYVAIFGLAVHTMQWKIQIRN